MIGKNMCFILGFVLGTILGTTIVALLLQKLTGQ